MWAYYESYDPDAQILYLDLISEPAAAPRHPKLAEAKLLESFEDLLDAQRFADGYLKALSYGTERIVREVRCGHARLGGCRGPGQPCYLGLDSYHCPIREGAQ